MTMRRGSTGGTFAPNALYYRDTDSVYVQLTNLKYDHSYHLDGRSGLRTVDIDKHDTVIGITFRSVEQHLIDTHGIPEGERVRNILKAGGLERFLASPSTEHRRVSMR